MGRVDLEKNGTRRQGNSLKGTSCRERGVAKGKALGKTIWNMKGSGMKTLFME